MSETDTVRLIPFTELLDLVNAVKRMRESQKQFLRLRGEQPHMNLEPLYQLVRRQEGEVDRRVREAISRGHRDVATLFAQASGGVH